MKSIPYNCLRGGKNITAKQFKITNQLHVLRAQRRLTQESLAISIGITRATVIALEKGHYNPTLELAFRLSRFFNKTIEEIFTFEGGSFYDECKKN